MKDIVYSIPEELSSKYDDIEIHTFADLHIGDKYCNYKDIKERIDYVLKTPNAFVILNGDLMNNAISTSDPFSEQFTPMGQCERVVELFKDIAPKTIAILNGNHETRTYRQSGIDISQMYAIELGLSERYAREGALIFLSTGFESKGRHYKNSVRKVHYCIYATHGSGGGKMEGGKINRLAYLSSICDADIYIMGHTHLPAVFKEGYVRVDTINHTHRNVSKLFVNNAASLEYGGYGEAFGFKPSSIECPVIHVGMNKKWYKAVL